VKNAKSILVVAILGGLTAVVFALPDYFDVLSATYNVSGSPKLSETPCSICHVSEEDFGYNPFGKALQGKMQEAGKSSIDAELLAMLESEDSDGDGIANVDELKGDSFPGDPASKPSGEAAASTDSSATPPAPTPGEAPAKPLVPKHAYHGAFVHFPLALFLAGLLFDTWGFVRKNRDFLMAGWYNLVLAAVTAIVGLASGFAAMILTRLPAKGIILEHMLFAIGTTIAMWIMVSLRVHKHDQMSPGTRVLYYTLAAGATVMLSWVGHLGGIMVYGE